MERAALIVVGLAVGVLVAVGAVWWWGDDDGPALPSAEPIGDLEFPPVDHEPGAARDFRAAWERWRTAGFVATGTWTRSVDGRDDQLRGTSYRAQDPPRRLVIRLGSVIERTDGSVFSCDGDADVVEDLILPECVAGETSLTYDERVAAEMANVDGYVLGDGRLYDVAAAAPGCWQLELRNPVQVTPWGRWAEFCFADDSGALTSSRIRRASSVDREELRVQTTEVTDADFRPTGEP